MRNSYRYVAPPLKLGIVVLISLLSLVLVVVLSAIIAVPIWGIDGFMQIMGNPSAINSDNVGILKYFQLWQTVGLFVFPAIILAYLFSNNVLDYLKVIRLPFWQSCLLCLVIMMAYTPFIGYIGQLNSEMSFPNWFSGVEQWMRNAEDSAKVLTDLFLVANNGWGLLVNLVVIAVVPAIGEELLFRGVIQKVFFQWTKNTHWAIWITAILFSALHLQFYGFLPRMLLGALFGYFFVFSKNLWLPILAHFFNNGFAVVAYYFYNKGEISVNPDEIGTERNLWPLALLCLLVVLYLCKKLYEFEKRKAEINAV